MTDLVIFDCDGVLVDSETITNEILIEDLAGYGLTLSLDDCDKLFVGGTMLGVSQTVRDMGAEIPQNWVEQIYKKMYDRLAQGVAPVPGIPELLDHLDDTGIAFCVASNGHLEKMQITLGQNGLWDRFEGRRFSAYAEGVAKPDPGLFLAAAQRCGATPDRCLVIEDSKTGVLAAQRAGIRCLAYLPNGDGAHLEAHDARVIRSMHEVPGLLFGDPAE